MIEVEVTGPAQKDGRTFSAKTTRKNPADPGAGDAERVVHEQAGEVVRRTAQERGGLRPGQAGGTGVPARRGPKGD